jgi:hypothetical protein
MPSIKPVVTMNELSKAVMQTRKELIKLTVMDLVSSFLYYDRKEDEDLPEGEIQKALDNNEITFEEIVITFKKELFKQLY